MKQIFLLISLFFAHQALAVCSSPIARTNFSANQVLTSTRLNTDLNNAYTRANELPGDCITSESITTTQIDDGTITNADISASAAIDLAKTNYAVAVLKDVKSSGTEGGTFTQDAWQVRVLNTEEDPSSIVSLASNQFTLAAGTYFIEGFAPAYVVTRHIAKIYNVTDAADSVIGSTGYAGASEIFEPNDQSFFAGVVTIVSSKVFEVRHYCKSTVGTKGLGTAATITGTSEVFTTVKITRIK